MAVPTQIGYFERQPSGWWIDMRTGAGPFKTADGITFTLAGSGGGGGQTWDAGVTWDAGTFWS